MDDLSDFGAEATTMGPGMAAFLGLMLVAGGPSPTMPPPAPAPTLRPGEFESWFRLAVAEELPIPTLVRERAAGFRYVFVGGFHNERMPGYFSQNRVELRAQGVPRADIHVINPSSRATFEQNAATIRGRFEEIATAGGPGKLVIIGHSRGACDALAFAMANPGFVRDRVEAIFLVQGPFGGTGVAEYVLGLGHPMDRKMPIRQRVIGHLFGRLVRSTAGWSTLGAMAGMTRESSRRFWERALKGRAEAREVVEPRTFFIRSQVDPSRLRFVRRAIAWYLKTYHGPSDGMVALADQMLPGFGTPIGPLEAGHSDLTHRFPATRVSRRLRMALVRAIVMTVGRPAPAEPAVTAR